MKNKILYRLIAYFVTTFLVFSLVIGMMFSFLFARHNLIVHKAELEKRSVNVASTLSTMLENRIDGEVRRGTGYGAYLRFIEDISMNEVWVVSNNLQPISYGHTDHDHIEIMTKSLPDWAITPIKRAIEEETVILESVYSDGHIITVIRPIVSSDGTVFGAVMLQSHVLDLNEVTSSGITLLIFSIAAAIIISIFIAVMLSNRFTKPLGMMKTAAKHISAGDYSVKTGVTQPDEIGELAIAMDEMADKLDAVSKETLKLDKLRKDFIANISHELRTPVTVIRGSLEALCDGVVVDAAKIAEYHNQMLSESFYLERLVTDLLDLARLQNPDFAIEMEMVDLKYIAEDAVRGMKHIAAQKDIKILLTSDGINYIVAGDYARLRQMLIVVLDNAIKFSPAGKKVSIALFATETINMVIQDEGCGISPEELPHIFERFYKQRSEENKTGTGLGLAIVQQIADRHGVKIGVMSSPDKGTEVRFVFQHHNIKPMPCILASNV